MVKTTDVYSFRRCFVQDADTFRVIAQLDVFAEAGEPDSTIMKWVRSERQRYDLEVDWAATRLAVVNTKGLQLFVTGPDGRVLVAVVGSRSEEQISAARGGPSVFGPIRDLCAIGDQLFAVGMSRQVYRRKNEKWSVFDDGVLFGPSTATVCGFNALDGAGVNDLYAVGFGGEVWRCKKGEWRQLRSPTNVILNAVKVAPDGRVFACGKRGVILVGSGDKWRVVEHGAGEEEFWSLEWFNGTVYCATSSSVFRLSANENLEKVEFGRRKISVGHLHANGGVLLSCGAKDLRCTEDGKTWEAVEM